MFWIASLSIFLISVFSVLMLRWVNPPTTSFVLQAQWSQSQQKKRHRQVKYRWVDWNKISPYISLAVIASEDQRFAEHDGFDFNAIMDAVEEKMNGGRMRGASTISQQVAKNLFLWPEQSFVRKGLEAYFTLLIEILWSKQRILETYINVAEFGDGVYGVAAASQVYFNKSPRYIEIEEAALLAAVLPNPKRMVVSRPSEYVRSRQFQIIQQMRMLGGIRYMDLFGQIQK